MNPIVITEINEHIDNAVVNLNSNINNANTHAYNANTYAKNANTYAYNANLTITNINSNISNIINDLTNLATNINNANLYAYNSNIGIAALSTVPTDLTNMIGQLNDISNQLSNFNTNINLIPNIDANVTCANLYAKNANTYAYNANTHAYNANTYAKNANTYAYNANLTATNINATVTNMDTNVTCSNYWAYYANQRAYYANQHAYNAEQNAVAIKSNTNLIPDINTNVSCSNYWAYYAYMRANALYNGGTTGVGEFKWYTIYKSIASNSLALTTSNQTEGAYVKKVGSVNFSSSNTNVYGYSHVIFGLSNTNSNVSISGTKVQYTLIISKDNLTTTTLDTYNTLLNSSNTVFSANYSSPTTISSTKTNMANCGIIYTNIFNLNTTYYFYWAIHRNADSHNAEKINWYVPRTEIQMYFCSNDEYVNKVGVKRACTTKIIPTGTNTYLPLLHCQIIDTSTSYLEPKCEFIEHFQSSESSPGRIGYCIVNSNIWPLYYGTAGQSPYLTNDLYSLQAAPVRAPIFIKEYY